MSSKSEIKNINLIENKPYLTKNRAGFVAGKERKKFR